MDLSWHFTWLTWIVTMTNLLFFNAAGPTRSNPEIAIMYRIDLPSSDSSPLKETRYYDPEDVGNQDHTLRFTL